MNGPLPHTPGPWSVEITGRQVYVNEPSGGNLAQLGWEGDECLANARLFAAAPDLLVALEQAIEHLGELDPCVEDCDIRVLIDTARDLIAKAQGASDGV